MPPYFFKVDTLIMKKIIIEMLAPTACDGTCGKLPGEVDRLITETGAEVEFIPYEIISARDKILPDYITARLDGIERGEFSADGLFIGGEWFDLRPHNADDVIKLRRRFAESSEVAPFPAETALHGVEAVKISVESARIGSVNFANSVVTGELGSFSTDFDAIWFFEGSIKKLSIDNCSVESFTYRGYDVNKLVEIADKHPELFCNNATGETAVPQVDKANIDDVEILPVTDAELDAGYHPCFLVGNHVDGGSTCFREAVRRFGCWGYQALCFGECCGWLGVLPKDVLHADRGWVENCPFPDESVLYLGCYLGGGNYSPRYNRIGIARKLIMRAISDARDKGYMRVDAYPHPEVIPVLLACGFSCEERVNAAGGKRKYMFFDIIG